MDLLKCKDHPEYRLSVNNHIVPPGQMQYHVSAQEFIGIDTQSKIALDTNYDAGYKFERHTLENRLRLTPDTASGNANAWKLLLVMKHEVDGQICLKGALRNAANGEIALMTSINGAKNDHYSWGNATIKSHDSEWHICHCSMQAPLVFWDELKNRLVN